MAIQEELDLLYELNERGENVLVRSTESNRQAYLRFSNLTGRPVDVWWRDFDGVRRHYFRLKPNMTNNVNSFITHPWEFTDADTKERYCVRNSYIFRPPPNIGGMKYRTNWNITVGVRTLRHSALLAIAVKLPDSELVADLELPKSLQEELEELVTKICAEEPPL